MIALLFWPLLGWYFAYHYWTYYDGTRIPIGLSDALMMFVTGALAGPFMFIGKWV